jgi:hypothetical protein
MLIWPLNCKKRPCVPVFVTHASMGVLAIWLATVTAIRDCFANTLISSEGYHTCGNRA